MKKFLQYLFKRPKSVNDSASQSNSTRVSVCFDSHDPVSGNDTGSAEPTASSKYIGFILVFPTTTWSLQMSILLVP